MEIMIRTLSNFSIHMMATTLHQIHLVLSSMEVKQHLGSKILDSSLSMSIQIILFQQQLEVLSLILLKQILDKPPQIVLPQLKYFLILHNHGCNQIL